MKAGYQAAGTVTGAASCPDREPLMIFAGHAVLLWPDADHAGRMHMLKVAKALGEPGDIAASLGWITWPDAPEGGDAADALAAGGSDLIDRLIANAGDVPTPEPTPAELIDFSKAEERRTSRRRQVSARSRRRDLSHESPIERFNREVTVSEVLRRSYGIEARPGRAIRCPRHDDRSPSLSVLPDDRRVYCHSPACDLNNNGQGRDAWDLAQLLGGAA